MSQGRGSAYAGIVRGIAVLLLVCFIVQIQVAQATIFTVGDDKGWSFNVTSWTVGKKFLPGDVLVFKYNPNYHNVVKVSSEDFESCTIPTGSQPLKSGIDHIVLENGKQYYVCGVPGHCAGGMKIAVDASTD